MSKQGRKSKARQTSGMKEHRRAKKQLLPPLAQLENLTPVRMNRDVLPELLLIDGAVDQLTWNRAPGALHKILDVLDQFVPSDSTEVLRGTISSMGIIREDQRAGARAALLDLGLLTNGTSLTET